MNKMNLFARGLLSFFMTFLCLTGGIIPRGYGWDYLPARKKGPAFVEADKSSPARAGDVFGELALSFEPNQGQADPKVKFISRGPGYTLMLAPDEAVMRLRGENNKSSVPLRMRLARANPKASVRGLDQLPGKSNYFIGNDPKKWRAGVNNYAKVECQDVYRGIDLVYYGAGRELEYDFVVKPGASPRAIGLAFEGAQKIRIDDGGELVLDTEAGQVRQRRPVVYQEIDGVRRPVTGRFIIKEKQQVGFEIGKYDASKPLVIDPTLEYSTYLGGSGGDEFFSGITIDSEGNAYVTGNTNSLDFPVTPGAFQTSNNGGIFGRDIFVAKLNPTGTALLYATYIGGGGDDFARKIAVDSGGNAYVAGTTFSSDFPTTPGAFRTGLLGLNDGYVTKLNPTGSSLDYSTLLGSAFTASAEGIAVDGLGNAYVVGSTRFGYPTTPGAFQANVKGEFDIFVTKLNPSGSAQIYSTVVGGLVFDSLADLAVDPNGNAYVTGRTNSMDFPVTPGAFQTIPFAFFDFSDAFVFKLNDTGTGLVYSTYLGRLGSEQGNAITVSSSGVAYVAGMGGVADFPVTPGAFDTTFNGNPGFVVAFDQTGSSLIYSTFLGGSRDNLLSDIAIDEAGNAYITGSTRSDDFPITPDAFQSTLNNLESTFLSVLNPTGSSLTYSTFLGGSSPVLSRDVGIAIALDDSGDVYITGHFNTTDFPTTPNAFQTTLNGGADGFITKFRFESFDICLQDDTRGDTFQFNSSTGEYRFTRCGGGGVSGTGVLTTRGCVTTLQDSKPDRRILVRFDTCLGRGTASVQVFTQGTTVTLTDRDIRNNSCACP